MNMSFMQLFPWIESDVTLAGLKRCLAQSAMSQTWQKLLTEVQGLHDFVEAQKAIMAKQNIEKLMQSHVDQISARAGSQIVHCPTSFAHFFSGKDVDILASDATLAVKIDCITTRMKRIGLHLPTEQTWRPIMQAAQTAGMEVGNEKNQVDFIRDLKACLHKKKDRVESHLIEFPSTRSRASMVCCGI